jgi:hypothetical protein
MEKRRILAERRKIETDWCAPLKKVAFIMFIRPTRGTEHGVGLLKTRN